MRNRRTFLVGTGSLAGALLAGGCVSPGPTTQPSNDAQTALNNIEATEAIAMVAISVADSANLIPHSDYLAAQAADRAFQVAAKNAQLDITNGTGITPAEIANDLSAVLLAVVSIHSQVAAKPAVKAVRRKSVRPA
jgi:hypothetical protein